MSGPFPWDMLEFVVALLGFILLTALFIRGFIATREINRIYTASARPSPILRQIRDGSVIKVGAAAWFVVVTLRALSGLELAEPVLLVIRVVSLLFAALVLDLPSRYLKMARRIMNGEHS